jgi:hypothetical protein
LKKNQIDILTVIRLKVYFEKIVQSDPIGSDCTIEFVNLKLIGNEYFNDKEFMLDKIVYNQHLRKMFCNDFTLFSSNMITYSYQSKNTQVF